MSGIPEGRGPLDAPRDYRDFDDARRDAIESLTRFTEAALECNAPDDEHTRWQVRRLVDDVLNDVMRPDGFDDEREATLRRLG